MISLSRLSSMCQTLSMFKKKPTKHMQVLQTQRMTFLANLEILSLPSLLPFLLPQTQTHLYSKNSMPAQPSSICMK